MKRISSILISTALVLSAFAQMSVGAKTNASSPLQQRRASAIRFAPRQINEANRKLRYTIKAKYPQAVGSDPRLARLNTAIKSLMTEQVAGFKKDFQAPE